MYSKDINRLNDYLFKWLFGREENKDMLLSLINSVLELNENSELVDITLTERELDPLHIQDKLSRLDIIGKANDGSVINVEVQLVNQHNMDKRTLYYWAKLYQLKSGIKYNELCRTVTINVLNFKFLPDSQNYHSMFGLYDITTGYRLNEDLEIHFIEIPKWSALGDKPKKRLAQLSSKIAPKQQKLLLHPL